MGDVEPAWMECLVPSANSEAVVGPRIQISAIIPVGKRFDPPEAKRFSVWFCDRCGSRVPHKVRGREDVLIPAGLLDADPVMRPEMSIFWGSKAPWYQLNPGWCLSRCR